MWDEKKCLTIKKQQNVKRVESRNYRARNKNRVETYYFFVKLFPFGISECSKFFVRMYDIKSHLGCNTC